MKNLIKDYANKLKNNIYFPFIIFAIGVIIFHLLIKLNYGDDIKFSEVLGKSNIIQWVSVRYETWSSRIIVDFVMVVILGSGTILWKILDIAMILLLVISLSKIFITNKKNNWIIVAFLIIYPFEDMRSAGWGATTINYMWTLALGIYSLIVWKKMIFNQKIKKYEYFLSLLAALYACGVEQMCGILIGTYLVLIIYSFVKRKLNLFMILSLVISSINLVIILLCPGNNIRKFQETATFFNDYNQLSFFDKLQLGFSSTIAKFIFEPNFIFIVFTLLLGVLVVKKSQSLTNRIIAFVPFLSALFLGIGFFGLKKILPDCPNIINLMTKYGIIDLWNRANVLSYFILILLIIIQICVLVSIYYCFGKTIKTLGVLFILLIGLASRIIMGFSPTIWASGDRTFIFIYFSIIIVAIILYEELYKVDLGKIKYVNYIIKAVAMLSLIKLMIYIVIAGIFINKANLFNYINYIKSKF